MTGTKEPNIVCIGGGTGQAAVLRGLKQYPCNLTAIVAVTDSGRSTGRLRKQMDILAPGDIRNCLVSLSDSPKLLKNLFQYRFDIKEYEGMSFGNLFIAALSKVTGSFDRAVEEAGKILAIKGNVLPSTLTDTHLCADLIDGTKLDGEFNIRALNKSPIKKIYLKPKAKAYSKAANAILDADLIVIGPGSLYTSLIANLVVDGISEAIRKSKARKVYICNMMTQPGATDNLSLENHILEIEKYLGKGVLDHVIVDDKKPCKELLKKYEEEGGCYLYPDKNKLKKYKFKIIYGDFIDRKREKQEIWQKQDYLRHDSDRIAEILIGLYSRRIKAVILAAGRGTRMRPFSFSESKVLINFLGKPLIAHHVDEFLKNEITDFVIVCNENNRKKIENYFTKNYPDYSFNYSVQEEMIGPSHAICTAKMFLKGGYFIVKYGDSLSSEDQVRCLLEEFNKDKKVDAVITLRKIRNPSEYGIARFVNKKLVEIVEKPKKNAPSNLANVGLCLLNGKIFFESVEDIGFEKVLPPPEYVLRKKGNASYWVTKGKRVDVGRAWNIIQANELLIRKFGGKTESLNISKYAKIGKDVYVGPNAVIRADAVIKGYSSVDCFVDRNTIINNSFVMKGSRIGKNCLIEESVIGKDNLIEDNFKTLTKSRNDIMVYVKDKYFNSDKKELGLFTGANVRIMEGLKSFPGKMVFPNKVIMNDINKDMLIRAILFDADNTLYKTKKAAKKSDMQAMKFFSKQCSLSAVKLYEEWSRIVRPLIKEKEPKKRHRKHSYGLLAEKFKLNNVDKAFDLFLKELVNDIEEMPDLKDVIHHIEKYNLAVFSEDTSDMTLPKLKKFGLDKIFDVVITSDMIGEMKPSENYFKEVFEKFNVSPNECLVIGDNYEKDLEIPQKMGATVVNFGSVEKRADYSIESFKEIEDILKKI